MTYKEASDFLGDSECKATTASATRIRRESPRCIALYYDSRPILKWLDNGDIIIHPRGCAFTSAMISRIHDWSPIRQTILNEGSGTWLLSLPPQYGSSIRGISGGIRLNTDKYTHTRIV